MEREITVFMERSMNGKDVAFHYVCIRDEARELIKKFNRFWVSRWGCREERGSKCRRSRIDLRLMFRDDVVPSVGRE